MPLLCCRKRKPTKEGSPKGNSRSEGKKGGSKNTDSKKSVETEELTIQAPLKSVRRKLRNTDELVPLLFPKGVECKRTWGFNGSRGATYRSKKGSGHKMIIKKIGKTKLVVSQVNSSAAAKKRCLPKKQEFTFILEKVSSDETIVTKTVSAAGWLKPKGRVQLTGRNKSKNDRSVAAKHIKHQSVWIHEYLEEKDKKFKHFKKRHGGHMV